MNEYNDRLAIRSGSEQKVADFRQSPQQRPVTVQVLGIEGEEGPEDFYANDLDSRFEDRGSNEMSRFTFSPEESRSYYDETSERTWYDLALLPTQPNVVLKPGTIYLSQNNGKIHYTLMTPRGRVSVPTQLDAPIRFVMDHLIPLKSELLKLTTAAGYTRSFAHIVNYCGIDCVNNLQATPERERAAFGRKVYRAEVTEGYVGLILRNGVPEFVGPGKHLLIEPDETFVKYESVTSRLITHGSVKIIRVRDEELVCIKDSYKGGDFRLLSTGTHIIKSPTAKIYPVINAYGQEMAIRTSLEGVMPDPLDPRQKPTPPPATPAPASKDKSKEEKKEEKKPAVKATADERVIFEKVPKGKQGIAYDDKGNIQIFPNGVWYIPAQWKFYNPISDKKAILNLDLNNLISQDGIRCQVTASVEFKIKSIKGGVTEYGPNNIQVAIMDAAKNAVMNQVKKTTIFLKNYGHDNNEANPDLAVGPEDIIVAEMNGSLNEIEILNVSFTIIPASAEVVAALDYAKAQEIRQVSLMDQQAQANALIIQKLRHMSELVQAKTALIGDLQANAQARANPASRQPNLSAMFQPAPLAPQRSLSNPEDDLQGPNLQEYS